MKKTRFFFQDFLFEGLPIDEQEYPIVDVKELPQGEDLSRYVVVSLDRLLQMNKKNEWETLFEQVRNKDVCVKDDVPINNSEMDYYKTFYLRTYYYVLSQRCKSVYIC